MDFAFDTLGLKSVKADVDEPNLCRKSWVVRHSCREGGRERDRLQWEWRGVKSQGERQA